MLHAQDRWDMLELKLIRQASVNGIVELVYERRQTEKDNIQP